MHSLYRVILAAIGGILFIIIGIARQRERARFVIAGKKTESVMVWTSIIIAGICLLIFAAGVMIYQFNRH